MLHNTYIRHLPPPLPCLLQPCYSSPTLPFSCSLLQPCPEGKRYKSNDKVKGLLWHIYLGPAGRCCCWRRPGLKRAGHSPAKVFKGTHAPIREEGGSSGMAGRRGGHPAPKDTTLLPTRTEKRPRFENLRKIFFGKFCIVETQGGEFQQQQLL